MRVEDLSGPRLQAGRPGTLEARVYLDGGPVTPSGTPTVTVVDALTGESVASGNATASSGLVTFDLTAAQISDPALLSATWQLTLGSQPVELTTRHEVVGSVLFTEAEARAFDGGTLSSPTPYPAALVLAGRDTIADAFEEICRGRGFGSRIRRDELDGDNSSTLWLSRHDPQGVVRAWFRSSSSWVALAEDEVEGLLLGRTGRIERDHGVFPRGRRNVRVDYLYGLDPIPGEIRQAAMRVLRDMLVKTDLPDRATSQSNEFGAFALATAGMQSSMWSDKGIYGIPLVDTALRRYMAPSGGFR